MKLTNFRDAILFSVLVIPESSAVSIFRVKKLGQYYTLNTKAVFSTEPSVNL
jgi:hypothetical protein